MKLIETIIGNIGSRSAKITEQDGRYMVTMWVNHGETICNIAWKGQTLAGARRWAARMLSR